MERAPTPALPRKRERGKSALLRQSVLLGQFGAELGHRRIGGAAGNQCDKFNSKYFSFAIAGVTLAASSSAKNAFLMDILSLCA